MLPLQTVTPPHPKYLYNPTKSPPPVPGRLLLEGTVAGLSVSVINHNGPDPAGGRSPRRAEEALPSGRIWPKV